MAYVKVGWTGLAVPAKINTCRLAAGITGNPNFLNPSPGRPSWKPKLTVWNRPITRPARPGWSRRRRQACRMMPMPQRMTSWCNWQIM